MIVSVPTATPVTIPVVLPIVAMDVAELLQVPPVGAPVSVILLPGHTEDGPEIVGMMGTVLMVTVSVRPQESVKVMSVEPWDKAVRVPDDDMVATAVLLLVQVTPGTLAVKVSVAVIQLAL